MEIEVKCIGGEVITIELERGMVFELNDGERYMLIAFDEGLYSLVSLYDGNRWDDDGDRSLNDVARQIVEDNFLFLGYIKDLSGIGYRKGNWGSYENR